MYTMGHMGYASNHTLYTYLLVILTVMHASGHPTCSMTVWQCMPVCGVPT